MSKKVKEIALFTGLATILGAVTDVATSKKWEKFHTIVTLLGGGLTIYGALS